MENSIVAQINKEEVFKEFKDQNDPNAVFVEFNPLPALEKLLTLNNSSLPEKLSYAKHLTELIEIIGNDGVKNLAKIFENFMINDSDDVKLAILSQISGLTEYLTKKSDSYSQIIAVLIPALSKLLTNNNMQVKQKAGEEIGKLAHVLTEEDRGKYVLTTVLTMAHDDLNEDNRIVAVQLLSEMANCFGRDLCEQFVGLEILSLGEDPQIKVRKEAVVNLPTISRIVSHNFFKTRLLPFFLLAATDSAWIVRKACVENLVDVSRMCEPNDRETTLTTLMLKFLKDSNKWVKIASFKQLGPFISTLSGLTISEKLYDYYCQMTDSTLNSLSPGSEIIYACAFNFPAVLQAFGANRWPQMSKMFTTMMKKSSEIRKPLACSLHEIARIIGPERSEKDLIGILELILKDQDDEVKYGAIKNLSNFLTVFEHEKRDNLIDVFLQLQKDPKKWRIRVLIARQIDRLAKIYHPETVFRIISPISFKLCNDPVSLVREKAAKKIYAVFLAIKGKNKEEDIYQKCIIENIKGFLFMALKLLNYPEIFIKNFMDSFKSLANDKVANVRLTMAKILQTHWNKKGKMRKESEIIEIVNTLRNDSSKDVRDIAFSIEVTPLTEKEGSISPTLDNNRVKNQIESSPTKEKQDSTENNINNISKNDSPEKIKINKDNAITVDTTHITDENLQKKEESEISGQEKSNKEVEFESASKKEEENIEESKGPEIESKEENKDSEIKEGKDDKTENSSE